MGKWNQFDQTSVSCPSALANERLNVIGIKTIDYSRHPAVSKSTIILVLLASPVTFK